MINVVKEYCVKSYDTESIWVKGVTDGEITYWSVGTLAEWSMGSVAYSGRFSTEEKL